VRTIIPVLAFAACAMTAHADDTQPAAAPQRDPSALVQAENPSEDGLPVTLRESTYFYQSFGTTDPFRSLLAGDFVPKLQELVDLHTVKMVGVVWEPDDIAAILQDAQGFGYTLRPGDAVKNGSVVSVTQDAVVARLNVFGQTTQFTLRLQHEE
jgi:Tfp pilus assembly protein PilP